MSTGTSPLPPPPRPSPPPPRPSPSPPPPPPPVPTNDNNDKIILIGVVAIAVGGAVIICCMLVLLVYLLRRSKKDGPRTSRAQKKRRASYLSGEDVGTQPPPNAPATTPTARGGGGGGDSLRLASLHDVEQGGWPISPQHVALSPANSIHRTRGTDSLHKTRTEISEGHDGGGGTGSSGGGGSERPSRASTNRFSRLANRLAASGGGEVGPRIGSSHDAGGALNRSDSWAAQAAQRQYSTGGMIAPPGGAAAAPDSPNVAQLLHHRQQGSANGMLSSANSTRWRRSRFGRSVEVSQQQLQSPHPAGDGARATGSGPVRLALGHSDSEEDTSYTGVGVGQAHSYPVGHESRSMATVASMSKPTSPSGTGGSGRSSPRLPLRRPRGGQSLDDPVVMMNNPAYKPNWRSNMEEAMADALEAQDSDPTRRISAVMSLNGRPSGASGRVPMVRPRSGASSRAHATHTGMMGPGGGDGDLRRAGTLSGVVGSTDGDPRVGTMSGVLASQLELANGSVGSTSSSRRLTVGGTAAVPGRHLTELHAAPSVENVMALERSLPGSPRRASLVLPDSAFAQAPVYSGMVSGGVLPRYKSTS